MNTKSTRCRAKTLKKQLCANNGKFGVAGQMYCHRHYKEYQQTSKHAHEQRLKILQIFKYLPSELLLPIIARARLHWSLPYFSNLLIDKPYQYVLEIYWDDPWITKYAISQPCILDMLMKKGYVPEIPSNYLNPSLTQVYVDNSTPEKVRETYRKALMDSFIVEPVIFPILLQKAVVKDTDLVVFYRYDNLILYRLMLQKGADPTINNYRLVRHFLETGKMDYVKSTLKYSFLREKLLTLLIPTCTD